MGGADVNQFDSRLVLWQSVTVFQSLWVIRKGKKDAGRKGLGCLLPLLLQVHLLFTKYLFITDRCVGHFQIVVMDIKRLGKGLETTLDIYTNFSMTVYTVARCFSTLGLLVVLSLHLSISSHAHGLSTPCNTSVTGSGGFGDPGGWKTRMEGSRV